MKDFNVDINVLGLRNLQSFGVMPVKKASIQFNIRSLLPPQNAEAVQNIKTHPKSAGPNPNILTMISFSSFLPKESDFCPTLACEVYDNIALGKLQPRIGSFVIEIGQIIEEQIHEKERMVVKGAQLIAEVKEVLSKTKDFDPNQVLSEHDSQKMYIQSMGFEFTGQLNKGKKKKKKRAQRAYRELEEEEKNIKEQLGEIADIESGTRRFPA